MTSNAMKKTVVTKPSAGAIEIVSPDQAMTCSGAYDTYKGLIEKYPAPKRPNRNRPITQSEDEIWAEIDRTAPSRADLAKLFRHFRSSKDTV